MDEVTTAPEAPVADAPETGVDSSAPGTPKASNERMYKVKANDKEEMWPESKVLERASKAEGAEKAMKEAGQYKAAFENFVARTQNPKELIALLSHPDLKYDSAKKGALIEAMLESGDEQVEETIKSWLYNKRVKPAQMDPMERRAVEAEEKAAKLQSIRDEEEKKRKDDDDFKKVADIKEAYRGKMSEAYQKSGLPVDENLARQVLEKARLYVRSGKHPDFENCCKLVQADFMNHVKAVLGKATVENILSYMDDETPQKINKALLSALDRKQMGDVVPGEKGERRPKKKSPERTPEEKRKWLRNLERGII